MPQRSSKKKPNDANSLAASIVAEATDEKPKAEPTPEEIAHEAAVALGRLGGLKGGKARAASLTGKKVTPAVAAGLSDHVWDLSELIALLPVPVRAAWGSKRALAASQMCRGNQVLRC